MADSILLLLILLLIEFLFSKSKAVEGISAEIAWSETIQTNTAGCETE